MPFGLQEKVVLFYFSFDTCLQVMEPKDLSLAFSFLTAGIY